MEWFESDEFEKAGIPEPEMDCAEFRNERESGYGDLEGDWFIVDDDRLIIYEGTHGNDHSPGASAYTGAYRYDISSRAEFNAHVARLEAQPERID